MWFLVNLRHNEFYLNAETYQYFETNKWSTFWRRRICWNLEKFNVLFIWWITFAWLTVLPDWISFWKAVMNFIWERDADRQTHWDQLGRHFQSETSSVFQFVFCSSFHKENIYLPSLYDMPFKFYTWNKSICKHKLVTIDTQLWIRPIGCLIKNPD